MTLALMMKPSGAVHIGRDNDSMYGALRSWMKETLSLPRPISTFTKEETRSPVSDLRIRHMPLGVLDASSALVSW